MKFETCALEIISSKMDRSVEFQTYKLSEFINVVDESPEVDDTK